MKRVLCSSQFAQLVLPMAEDCRSEGAEAVRASPVVVLVLPSGAGLEFRLQSTEPSDPSRLPSNHGEEELVLHQCLLCLCVPGQIPTREKDKRDLSL